MHKMSYYGEMSVFENVENIDMVITDLKLYPVNEIKDRYPEVQFIDINTFVYTVTGSFVDVGKFTSSGLLESTDDLYLDIFEYLEDIINTVPDKK